MKHPPKSDAILLSSIVLTVCNETCTSYNLVERAVWFDAPCESDFTFDGCEEYGCNCYDNVTVRITSNHASFSTDSNHCAEKQKSVSLDIKFNAQTEGWPRRGHFVFKKALKDSTKIQLLTVG